jgi:hypothetical protein
VVLEGVVQSAFGFNICHINNILDGCVVARRVVQYRPSSIYHKRSFGRLLILPDPPCAIHHTMVKPEQWITGRVKYLTGNSTIRSANRLRTEG